MAGRSFGCCLWLRNSAVVSLAAFPSTTVFLPNRFHSLWISRVCPFLAPGPRSPSEREHTLSQPQISFQMKTLWRSFGFIHHEVCLAMTPRKVHGLEWNIVPLWSRTVEQRLPCLFVHKARSGRLLSVGSSGPKQVSDLKAMLTLPGLLSQSVIG